MATRESSPLLTVVEQKDVTRTKVRRGILGLGVCVGIAACVGVASGGFRSTASPLKLGDALDDALAELRNLDNSMDDGVANSASAVPVTETVSLTGVNQVDVPEDYKGVEDTPEFLEELEQVDVLEDVPVPKKVYDPVAFDAHGELIQTHTLDPENVYIRDDFEDVEEDVLSDTMSHTHSTTSEYSFFAESPSDSVGQLVEPYPDFLMNAEGTSSYDELFGNTADGPESSEWGDEWSDLNVDLNRIEELAESLGPEMAPTLVASYPPSPPRPDLPKTLTSDDVITKQTQSHLDFKFEPTFPGVLPEPSKAGHEVVAAAVANIPGVGLTDAQIELVRKNKERNAGLPEGSLKIRKFYYAIVDEFNLTNNACGGTSLNEYLVKPTLNESFALAQGSMRKKIAGVAPTHCVQTDVPEGVYENFNSEASIMYTVVADRDALSDFEGIKTFVTEASGIVHTPDFYTLLQAAILDSGASPNHKGSEIRQTQRAPTFAGFIVLEGPQGSADTIRQTNGPIMAAVA